MIILLGLTDFHFCRLLMYNSCVKCSIINVKTLNILIQKKLNTLFKLFYFQNYKSKLYSYTALSPYYNDTILGRLIVSLSLFFFFFIDSLKFSIHINECLLYTSSTIIRIIILMTIFRRLLHLHFY